MTQVAPLVWTIRRNGDSPARRIRHSLLYGVPLLNAAVLIVLCAAVSGRVVTAPSLPFALPAAEFASGAPAPFSATLVAPSDGTQPLLFFDGIRYRLADDAECLALRDALAASRRRFGWEALTLFADGRVAHADVMRFVAEARRAGADTVHVAVAAAPAAEGAAPRVPSSFGLSFQPAEVTP